MKVKAKLLENVSSVADNTRKHTVTLDLPPAKGGDDKGPTALELALMSLADCAVTIYADVAKKSKVALKNLEAEVEAEQISGEIIYIDRFGNGITNIGGDLVTGLKKMQIHIKSTTIKKLSNRYIDVPLGEPLVLIGSGNTLEISVHQGNAAQQIGFRVGDPITVSFK